MERHVQKNITQYLLTSDEAKLVNRAGEPSLLFNTNPRNDGSVVTTLTNTDTGLGLQRKLEGIITNGGFEITDCYIETRFSDFVR